MRILEIYAYQSPIKNKHPIEKILFTFLPLLLNLILQNVFTAMFLFFIMVVVTFKIGKIPIRIYLKLLLIPATFLSLSLIMILLNFSTNPITNSVIQYKIGFGYVSIVNGSIEKVITLFAVTLSSISCLYFLILTTTIQDLIYGLKCMKVPTGLLDIIALTYRFIFLFIDSGRTISHAQKSRLGNISYVKSLKSLGYLASALFVKVIFQLKELNYAVNARSLDGYTIVNNKQFHFSKTSWIAILGINSMIVAFEFMIRSVL